MKENLNEKSITIQMDFSENFVSAVNEEIQSFYFSRASVSLHPAVVHFMNKENKLSSWSYVAIIDDRAHTAYTVYAVQKQLIPMLKAANPTFRYIYIHYLTDSNSAQFRNVSISTYAYSD